MSQNEGNKGNKKYSQYTSAIIGGIIGTITTIAIIAILILIAYRTGTNGNNNNNTNNSANASNSAKANTSLYNSLLEDTETEHIIADSKLKYIPSSDMVLLTKAQIDEYMGTGYSNYYEFIAVNTDMSKMIYCFVIDKTTQSDYTAEQYIQDSLKNTNYEQITTQTIAETEFSVAQLTHEEEDKKYIEDCYVYKYDNKLLCIDFWHLDGVENNLAEMLQHIE